MGKTKKGAPRPAVARMYIGVVAKDVESPQLFAEGAGLVDGRSAGGQIASGQNRPLVVGLSASVVPCTGTHAGSR